MQKIHAERRDSDLVRQRVRAVVLRYGRNSTCYQVLNRGFEYWFSGNACVAFVRRGRFLVAAGEPICPQEDLAAVRSAFRAYAAGQGLRTCYVCAERGFVLAGQTTGAVTLGAQPVWSPPQWGAGVARNASLRAQIRRPAHKGVSICQEPAADPAVQHQLRPLVASWLKSRGMPALHFLTESDTFSGCLCDRLLWVARRGAQPVAFSLASPVPAREGYLVEQIVRRSDAPNGTAEALTDQCMRTLGAQGCQFVTLGLVAFCRHAAAPGDPLWMRAAAAWARAHGERFYRFRGLEQFRLKMRPAGWEPLYLAVDDAAVTPAALVAAAAAFVEGPLWPTIGSALAGAVRHEVRDLRAKVAASPPAALLRAVHAWVI